MMKRIDKLLDQLKADAEAVGGAMELTYDDSHTVLLSVDLGLTYPVTDSNCVASIDWLPDMRYKENRTYNVTTFNEDFGIGDKMLKRAKKLQKLAVNYSLKFWRADNR